MNVHVLPCGPIYTNAYLLTEPESGRALLIDAPQGVWSRIEPLLAAEACRLDGLWLTHGHWDHTQGAAEVVRRAKVPVLAHEDDRPLIEHPEIMREIMGPEIEVEPVHVDRWARDAERLDALGRTVLVRHVPGHCMGSLMFYFEAEGLAFTGDALFRRAVGRTDIPGGDYDVLEASIRTRIYALADATVVYPGHGQATTIGEEKRENPFVRA